MAVTRLERKARRNKTRAKVRVKTIKRNLNRVFVKSPYKDESGVILEVEDVFQSVEENNKNLKPAAKAVSVEKDVEAEVTTNAATETAVETVEEVAEVKKPAAKKPAAKKPAAKKAAAKKSTEKKPAAKKAATKKPAAKSK